VATDYATKWVEAKALRKADAESTAKFLYEHIITRFGCPLEIDSDQGSHFVNNVIRALMREFVIRHKQSTSYYPQGNGQAESTNRILLTSLRKLVADDPKHWDQELPSVLWAFRTAYKVTTGATPFQLAYGLEAIMP
jgi:transposase InsO family protein